METYIRIAVQKKGRLSEDSLRLIRECGIRFNNGKGALKAKSEDFPMEFLFLRDDDIPGYVADGVADLGIIGENVAVEKGKNIEVIKELGFSKCRLSLAVPREVEYNGIKDLDGGHIATSYPVLLGKYLKEQGVSASIHEISGSVEIAPGIGLADAVCDIVSTGSTLLSNGLKEVESIFKSQAVMVATPGLSAEKKALLDKFLFRIDAVQRAKRKKYIMMNAPDNALDEIERVLPGAKSPTITPLKNKGWSSVQAVINEDDFWEVIEALKNAGAEDILVTPIEKMVF
ncbi:ATP phosphoribosyltransferase [Fulvitalea axinellae]|uniref:ATP phosphoribosyltransferase n=1 Tax=Fulvitalea axinellae TaxID=1182444 RepID=A0AAU9CN97_9BACT|nr:ATP phosphoribosyltransferase [Fulvitalea axinellae]